MIIIADVRQFEINNTVITVKDSYARAELGSLRAYIENLPDDFGNNNALVCETLPLDPDANTDYYLLNNGVYVHYRYINDDWEVIGATTTDAYTKQEIDGKLAVFEGKTHKA